MNIDEWIKLGYDNGWMSIPSCYYHDMLPLSDEEEADLEEDGETCVTVARIYV